VAEQGESVTQTFLPGGGTPLTLASRCGHLNLVQWLVEAKAGVDSVSIFGWSPLIAAAEKGHLEIVKYLLSQGEPVDLNRTTNDGVSAVLAATHAGHFSIVQFLVHAGATINIARNGRGLLGVAAAGGHLDLVKWLVTEKHVEVDQIQNDGRLALDLAIEVNHIELVRWLLQEGRASVNACVRWSALRLALLQGHVKIVRLLVLAGARLEAPESIPDKPSQGLLLDALDKARLKRVRQALYPLGWDCALTNLVGRYGMLSWPEALSLLKVP